MQESIAQTDALPVAFGKRSDQLFLYLLKPTKFLYISDSFFDPAVWNGFETRSVIEVLGYPHIIVERYIFGRVTQMRPRF